MRKEVRLSAMAVSCEVCRGRGRIGGRKRPVIVNGVQQIGGDVAKPCEACNGHGFFVLRRCCECAGTGRGPKLVDDPAAVGPECRECKGTGQVRAGDRALQVRGFTHRRDLLLRFLDHSAEPTGEGHETGRVALARIRRGLDHLLDDLAYLDAHLDPLEDPRDAATRDAHHLVVRGLLVQAGEVLLVAERVLGALPPAQREAVLADLETRIFKL